MSKKHSDINRYEGKYGERTKSWDTKKGQDASLPQKNVKNTATGDHHFVNLSNGIQGTALGSYRPFRKG